MSREIKFRAWDGEKMVPQQALYWNGDSFYTGLWNNEETHIEGEDQAGVELMQYTGLKDRSGVEIYEGDILRDQENDALWVASFSDRGFFCAHSPNDSLDWVILLDDYTFQVVGNIHENPDLLK